MKIKIRKVLLQQLADVPGIQQLIKLQKSDKIVLLKCKIGTKIYMALGAKNAPKVNLINQ